MDKHPLYKTRIGRQKVLVLTDSTGANRVYDPQKVEFVSYDQDSIVKDAEGNTWRLTEESLERQDKRQRLERLPYHRAFWFGWRAAFPETKLIK